MTSLPTITVHLRTDDISDALRHDVRHGLTASPKWLPPKWFYDADGSELFDKITRLEEYYPTERERSILSQRAFDIATLTGADTLIELGSGTSEKTTILLDAFASVGQLQRFVAFDISESTLRETTKTLAMRYSAIAIAGVVGDFEHHLHHLPREGRRCVLFLGGTIGNLAPSERGRFLRNLSSTMSPGDTLLLGADLVKDHERLVQAYDDAAGITAAFNLNILRVINRELGADFDPNDFEHVALFDPDNEWIEMRLRSVRDHEIHIRDLDLTVSFARDEELRTEISAKFRRARIEAELHQASLIVTHFFTDDDEDFSVTLAVKR